jgi:adenosine deaminase
MPVNTRQIDDEESVQFRDGEETDLLTNHKWKYTSEMESFLRSIPKIELHVHLDGSFETSLLLEHLKSLGDFNHLPSEVTLPWDTSSTMPIRSALVQCETVQDLHALCTCRGKRSLYEMIKCFEIFLPIVRGNLELLETLSYNFCRRQSKCNVIYSEVRYSPHLLAEGGDYNGTDSVDARPVIDAVTRGLRRGEKDFNVKVRNNQSVICLFDTAWY